ncbi:unnamed protein product [Linum tenue]|uniref:Uncharacterized protein n=1 Tax=Linum tenue TaxID=586396 RepID=A0AAV0JHU3_9ROSI|nr:unnamed protein product [Linum tenue]
MLPPLCRASPGARVPQGSPPAEGPGRVRPSQGDRVRVDEAQGPLRPLLRGHQHTCQLRGGGDGLRGEAEDEEDERDQEQADVPLGPHLGDEHGGCFQQEDHFQDSHGDRQVFPRFGFYHR